jgi:hypothetical protein
VLLKLQLFFSWQGFPSRLDDVAGETLELSFETAIESRSDRSSRDVPSGVAKKCVGADLDVNHCDEYQRRCSLRRRGRSMTEGRTVRNLTQELWFLPSGRTVCACAEATEFAEQHLDLAPGRDPVEERF